MIRRQQQRRESSNIQGKTSKEPSQGITGSYKTISPCIHCKKILRKGKDQEGHPNQKKSKHANKIKSIKTGRSQLLERQKTLHCVKDLKNHRVWSRGKVCKTITRALSMVAKTIKKRKAVETKAQPKVVTRQTWKFDKLMVTTSRASFWTIKPTRPPAQSLQQPQHEKTDSKHENTTNQQKQGTYFASTIHANCSTDE